MITYDLTNPQKNILEMQKVNVNNEAIAHISTALKIKGNLDVDLLQKTLNIVIQKNDIFSLGFKEENNKYFQYFKKIPYQTFEVKKFEDEDISEFIEYYNNLPLSLEKLVSFAIVLTPKFTYIFYKSHHIIGDGWGMTQVSEQIKEIYCKLKNNEDISSYKKPSYIDFIKREQEYQNSERYNNDLTFWKEYVANINNKKIFHSDNLFDKHSERFEFPLSDELSNKIDTFCEKYHITEYTFFLAVFTIYFFKIHNMSSIVFGTPFLNRQKKLGEMESAGLFVSTLPLNISISNEIDFVQLCKNIASNNFSIYKHSKFPYTEIQNLYKEHTSDNTNIYDIGFSYQINELTYKMPDGDPGDFCWYFLNIQNNPLTIHLTVPNHKRVISYDYWTSCFTKDQIIQMNEIVTHLVNQILNDITTISELNLLPTSSLLEISKFLNSGDLEEPHKDVVSSFKEIVAKYPDKISAICGDDKITYKELDLKSSFVANSLLKNGITKNSPVVLCFDKSIDMLIAFLAVLKSNACYVPILPDEDKSRINYIIKDCSPFCILSDKKYISHFQNENIKVFTLDTLLNETDIIYKTNISVDDLAYIIYTSGSTGNPKGTMVMHKNISSLMASISNDKILKANSFDVSMSLLKYSFDASGIDIYTSLLFGGTLVLVPKEDELNPSKVLQTIEKHKVTRSFLIPKWLEHISLEDASGSYDLSSLRILGTGGEALKPYIITHLFNKYPNLRILNLYGPTEATMFTTCKIITNDEISNNSTSIGRPIYGSRLAVVNSSLDILPCNNSGELVIFEDNYSIKNIAKGYLNLPEQTSNKFTYINSPTSKEKLRAYRTGDMAKINSFGEIEFLGRDDDVVKVNGGYLVALNEVENKIQTLLGNNIESYPIAVPFKNTKIIVLFVVLKDKNINLNNIKNHINNNISFYMRPRKIIEIEDFPRNSSGKINRKQLKIIAEEHLANSNEQVVLPSTKIEKELFNIIKSFVNVDTISITDDFMDDLGLDSLTLTSFYSALDKYELSIQALYNNSNIKDLAYYIEHKKDVELLEPDLTNILDTKILNNTKHYSLKNILLTGVTGFLGIHLLKDLLQLTDTEKIYCIIRNKLSTSGEKRLSSMIKYFFNSDENLLKLIDEKVIILNGDITKKELGLPHNIYTKLQEEVTLVVNSAANVKHFVKPKQIEKDNVQSVKNIIEFCSSNITLSHISTLSISGYITPLCNSVFDENSFYIGQNLENSPYLISKFEAEKLILSSINKQNLNANIFRIGNIMPRVSDGIFQQNADQNVFLLTLNFITKNKVLPKSLLDMPIEFSPVDECSRFIVSLLKENLKHTVYHIANPNLITFLDFKEMLSKLNCKLSLIENNEFVDLLNNSKNEYIKDYLFSGTLNPSSCIRTIKDLSLMELEWKTIDLEYLKKVVEILKNKF